MRMCDEPSSECLTVKKKNFISIQRKGIHFFNKKSVKHRKKLVNTVMIIEFGGKKLPC